MKQLKRLSSICIIAALVGISFIKKQEVRQIDNVEEEALISIVENEINAISFYEEDYINKKTFAAFATALGHKESTNNYNAENRFGYVGRYQFGRLALRAVGLGDITKREFKKDSTLQDKAFASLLSLNKHYLRNYIDKYDGKRINGIVITESGMLAAAHLVGASSVKKYLNSNGSIIRKDGNGVALTLYLKKFGGYDTSSIEPLQIIDKDTYNLK